MVSTRRGSGLEAYSLWRGGRLDSQFRALPLALTRLALVSIGHMAVAITSKLRRAHIGIGLDRARSAVTFGRFRGYVVTVVITPTIARPGVDF